MGNAYRGRGSEVRIKDTTGNYKKIPGCQDINLNLPQAGTIDASDQDTPAGQTALMPGDVSEGSLEFSVNFDGLEPLHKLLEDRLNQSVDVQIKVSGPSDIRYTCVNAVVRSVQLALPKNELQRTAVQVGIGSWVRESDS